MKVKRYYNPLVIWLLRPSLHAVMSRSVLLLTYEGQRSGRTFTTLVSYVREGTDLPLATSRQHSWWKNLRCGAPVRLGLRGRDQEGVAEALEDGAAEGEAGLLTVLQVAAATAVTGAPSSVRTEDLKAWITLCT